MAERHGAIINLLNVFAKLPDAGTAPTSISRAAGMALTKVLSAEGAADNILVNAMLIGFIESDQIRRQHDASDGSLSLEAFIAKAGQRLPMKRMGRAEEAADLALFLASERASYLTGCAINMDGGLSRPSRRPVCCLARAGGHDLAQTQAHYLAIEKAGDFFCCVHTQDASKHVVHRYG